MWAMGKANGSLWLKRWMNARQHWFACVADPSCPFSHGTSTEVCRFARARHRWDQSSRYSLLFSLSLHQTRSSPSLFHLWQMRSQIRSSLSLVNLSDPLPRHSSSFLAGRTVVFPLAITNSLFYFSAGLWLSVFMSLRLLWNILFISGR